MKKHKRPSKKPLWPIIVLACLAVIAALGLLFGKDILDGWKSSQTEAQTRALYVPEAAANAPSAAPAMAANVPSAAASAALQSTVTPLLVATSSPVPEVAYDPDLPPVETPPPVQEDFLELYEQNEHFIGWLTAGERIDYPVVWSQGDNDFYLHHDFFGNADNNGTLFLNGNNRFFPANDVWLIHGHNMRSGAMFGTLGKYRDFDYLCQYPLITFRTIYDAETVYYVPIAAFDASMAKGNREYFDITQIAFPDDEEADALPAHVAAVSPASGNAAATPSPSVENEVSVSTQRHSAAFAAYLESLHEVSLWESPADVNVDDSLLMLITCSYIQQDGRFMLVCRKLRADETPESITALFQEE